MVAQPRRYTIGLDATVTKDAENQNTPNAPGVPKASRFSLFGLAQILLLIFVVLVTAREIIQVDPYFHLSAGAWILEHGFPETNVFLETQTEHPFIDHEWLYQIALVLGHKATGFTGLSILLMVATISIVLLLQQAAPRQGFSALAATSLFVFCAYRRFILRPEMVAFLGIALHLCVLERSRLSRRALSKGALAALLFYQWLWIGSHGTFFLGPALTLCFLVDSALREHNGLRKIAKKLRFRPSSRGFRVLLGLFIGQILLSVVTPYGLDGALYPFTKLASSGVEAERIAELQSPFRNLGALTLDARAYILTIAMGLIFLTMSFIRGRVRPAHLLVALGLGVISFQFSRTLPFGAAGMALVITYGLRDLRRYLDRTFLRAVTFDRVGFMVLSLVLSWAAYASWTGALHRNGLFENRLGLRAAKFFQYQGVIEYWEANPPEGNIFNGFGAGHYLLFARQGKTPKPFICANTDLYSGEFYDRYWDVMSGRTSFDPYLIEFGISDIFIDHRTTPGPIQRLDRNPNWRAVYIDTQGVLFRRSKANDSEPQAIAKLAKEFLEKGAEHPWLAVENEDKPYTQLHMAHFFSLWLDHDARKASLLLGESVHKKSPQWIPALFIHARAEQDSGRMKEAWEIYEQILEKSPADVQVRIAAANAALLARHPKEAIEHYLIARRSGQLIDASERGLCQAYLSDGKLVELRRLLADSAMTPEWQAYFQGRAAARENDLNRAFEFYEAALKARPQFIEVHYLMGELLYRSKKFRKGIVHFEEVIGLSPRDWEAWEYLGGSWYALKSYPPAITCWRRSWDIQPGRPRTAFNIGDAYFRAGDYKNAVVWSQRALERVPKEQANSTFAQQARKIKTLSQKRLERQK
ncbi:MAG: tetratricopeptide repeat protein [Planctomycetota bacterium]|nr:tetratricopeptide repeat protein [Planctomycetota bacterium]